MEVVINPVNDAPIARDDNFTGDEDFSIFGALFADDVDFFTDFDEHTFSLGTNAANGTVVVDAFGSFEYTPDADFNGTDSFTYTVTDLEGAMDTGTISLTVNPVNDDPVTEPFIEISGDEDTTISGTITAIDVDGDALTFSPGAFVNIDGRTSGGFGTVSVNADGSFDYVPDANFNGIDFFDVTVDDGNGGFATANVDVIVNPVNDAPTAVPDPAVIQIVEDTPLLVDSVFEAFDDIDLGDFNSSEELTLTLETQPTNGSAAFVDTGFGYIPSLNFNGTDSFEVRGTDAAGAFVIQSFDVEVAPVNDAPIASAGSLSGDEDTALSGSVAATDVDGDALSFAIGTGAANGAAVVASNGDVTYTPDADFNGTDSFTYTVSDGNGGIATETVSVTVAPVNDAPVASAGSLSGDEDTALSGSVAATDVDGDALTFAIGTGAANGAAVVASNGDVTYTPDADFNGTDSFTYTVSDGNGGTANETVNVTVNRVNDLPIAAGLILMGDEDTLLSGIVTAADVDGDVLTFALESDATNGAATVAANGDVTYTPNADFNGTDSFIYTVSDGNGGTTTETVQITVNEVPDEIVIAEGEDGDVAGVPNQLNGNVITGFDAGDQITAEVEEEIAFEDVTVDVDTGTVTIPGASFTVDANLDENSFVVIENEEGNTELLLVEELLGDGQDLQEGQALAEDDVNGLVADGFFSSANANQFAITFDQSQGALDNLVGFYTTDETNRVTDGGILFGSSQSTAVGTTMTVNVADGDQLEFFLIQNGAGLDDAGLEAALEDIGSLANIDNANAARDALGGEVFFSGSSALNSDGIEHFVSGAVDGGGDIRIGIEDLTGGGDRDFQDVVFTVAALDELIA